MALPYRTLRDRNLRSGKRLRVATCETLRWTRDAAARNLARLAPLQLEANRRGHTRAAAWLGERMSVWCDRLGGAAAAAVIAKALA
ncbi:MAG: hypothetical protein RLY93_12360 [Sumerlaeia bacterium]